jgi:putative transposase
VGQIELQVSRDRDGRFCPTLFKAYERQEQAFQLALMEMVLHGVSTRKVTDVVEALCGHSLPKAAVSAMTADLMDGVNEWLERPLAEGFVCIMLDATYVKVRKNGRLVSRAVLIAVGIRSSGEREVLGVAVLG